MSTYTAVTVISAIVPRAKVDLLLEVMSLSPFTATSYEDVIKGENRIDIFIDHEADVFTAVGALIQAGKQCDIELVPTVKLLPPQDWAESWKQFFHVEHISERIVIRPSWEPYQATAGEHVIDLDPGMSFGTGQHGTTRACLKFIDRIAYFKSGYSMLDMGCGSGILAIAAAKLGFKPVKAFDNDPDAVKIAAENAKHNRVDINFACADLLTNRFAGEVVAANILAPVLIEFAAPIAKSVKPGGDLIISGILDTLYKDVLSTFISHGFIERENMLIDEWRSGWLQKIR